MIIGQITKEEQKVYLESLKLEYSKYEHRSDQPAMIIRAFTIPMMMLGMTLPVIAISVVSTVFSYAFPTAIYWSQRMNKTALEISALEKELGFDDKNDD
ncbi:MAG: hypothetical protein ABIC91_08350 [Nanoarchaeota archaeon]|nr:hypothetical protein [Nanoarchaeota archaeon]MBU1030352.1 hypothetical protein [Nanoarchaeota archaeon]MBU1849812.1 hypothetical protein [Nanoarchaeota archaeon]